MPLSPTQTIAVVGLGYVGLPLAVAFGQKYKTIGYDRSTVKIDNYRNAADVTGEVSTEQLKSAHLLSYTNTPSDLRDADVVIIAVPTPVDEAHNPDFTPLIGASITVGQNLKKGAIVVYESTVYPGATEEVCLPLLEAESGLKWPHDFNIGYSPERINPGDKERTLTKIIKVVGGDTPETLDRIAALYGSIITAGVHRASSIKVAEAAKVIENTQRDLNIALMNELSLIFHRLDINTMDVLKAAETKWNFLPFRPGLVGGHCIGVDPYYLTHKAEMTGYHPQVILAGRRINDGMASYVAQQTVKQMIRSGSMIKNARVHVLGLTFKENCPDLRNSKIADLIHELQDFGCSVNIHDPLADTDEANHEYSLQLTPWDDLAGPVDAVVLAAPHTFYKQQSLKQLTAHLKPGGVFVDIKSVFTRDEIEAHGFIAWQL